MLKNRIVLLPFPFDDLTATKVRPAVCLTNPIGAHKHIVLAFISSRIPAAPMPTDLVIEVSDPDFAATQLRAASTIQVHRLMTVTTSVIQRKLGVISALSRHDSYPNWRNGFVSSLVFRAQSRWF
jgi:mRNA interferase MazF